MKPETEGPLYIAHSFSHQVNSEPERNVLELNLAIEYTAGGKVMEGLFFILATGEVDIKHLFIGLLSMSVQSAIKFLCHALLGTCLSTKEFHS